MQESPGIQLLIAEDSSIVRDRLVSLAGEYLQPHAIQTAATGADAVAAFDRGRPDAVLLDIGLPDMSGLAVLEHIRRQGASTEVIIFSNSGGPEMVARCHLLGADHFVDKAQDVGPVIELLRTIAQPRSKGLSVDAGIPAASPRPGKASVARARSTAKPVSLLVVEDDVSQASPLVKLLERKLPAGSTIAQARSLLPALELMEAGGFQVVLLDLGLPDCDGVSALVAVRHANPDAAIIVLTARDDEETIESAMVAGADDYFVKGELSVSGLTRAIIYAAEGKRIERALSASLESRTRIMDSSADVICTLDAAGRFAEVGAASSRMWGYPPGELVGRNAREWVASADLSKTDEFFTSVRKGETVRGFEHQFVRSDGSLVPMMWSGAWSAPDRLMYCVARDITERKRAEATLRATVESALDCIVTVDEHGTVLEFNPAAEKMFGFSRKDALHQSLVEMIIPARDREGYLGALKSFLATDEAENAAITGERYEIQALRSNGTEFPMEIALSRIGTGRPAVFTVFMRDISERFAAQEKLRTQEEQYRLLFESSPNAMWVYDLKSLRILAVNTAAVKQYGYTREEFLRLTLLDLRPADEGENVVRAISAEGAAARYAGTWQHLAKGARAMLVDVYSSPTTFEGIPARMAVLVDVTEQKRAEELLQASERAQRAIAVQLETERARLLSAQSVAKVGDWEIDLCTEARVWSEEAYRILEIAPEPGPSHGRFLQVVHPDDLAGVEAAFTASFSQHSPCAKEHRLLMPDGRIKYVEHRWLVTHDEHGKPLRATGTVQDITERNEAHIALQKEREFLAALVENVSDGIVSCDANGIITLFNSATREFHGLPSEPVPADRWAEHFDIYLPDGKTRMPMEQIPLFRALNEGSVHDAEMVIAPRGGTARRILARGRSFANELGDKLGAVVAMHDVTATKEAEEKLETERARLLNAQRVAKVGDWQVDFLTQTRTWSAETYRIYEVDLNERDSSHERFMQIVHPEDRNAVRAASAASLDDRGPATVSHRLLMPDGRIKFIEQHWQVVYNDGGRPVSSTGTVQDITEREEAQEVLRRSQRNLALAQSISHTGSWEIVLDEAVAADDRDLHWSDEQFRIFGFEPGAVSATQRLFFALVHEDDRARVGAAFAAAFESTGAYSVEHRITWPDGSEHEIHEQAEFLRDGATGAVIKIIGTSQDVTERNRAQRTLREQAEMLNLAHDAIVVRGAEDRVITFWNKGAEHLYGWTAQEAIGRRLDDLLFDDQAHYEAIAKESEAGGRRGEIHQVAKDGRPLVVNAGATVIRNSDGTPRSVLVIQTDITEHKKLESQFLRAQRLESIGTLASGVAHDLNNVLAPILMSAPLLRGELTPGVRTQIVDTIEKSAERGAQIVKQVLTFARGVDGERVLLDSKHLIKEMAEIAEQTFPKTIQVTTRYTEDLALLEGDPTQLHQVLLNLAVNARDAMPAGGKLTLSAENFEVDEHYAAMTPGTKAGPHVLINVTDTGTGIPAHVMEKMFDPFFTTKEIGKGTGLGLSTLLGIVKSHGGAVNAYSTPAGTTFRVLLPAASTGELGAVGAAPELLPGRGETILIVDDEPAIREVAQVLLEKNGYKVLLADDGPAALAMFAQRQSEIALVLTDFLMPIMNGVSLARIIRKMDPTAKVIISSGREDDCSATELEAIGIAASLTKPYTQVTLLRALHRVLRADEAISL